MFPWWNLSRDGVSCDRRDKLFGARFVTARELRQGVVPADQADPNLTQASTG
jgi:hypothetical protein